MTANEFRIIGGGLGRTGTKSLSKALNILLPGKCYHWHENYKCDHDYFWTEVMNDRMPDDKFVEFFLSQGYTSGIAYPFYVNLEQAMRAFPKAKVLVSVRDPKEWAHSVKNTIVPAKYVHESFVITLLRTFRLFRRYIPWFSFKSRYAKNQRFDDMVDMVEAGKGEEFYGNWIVYIHEVVPKEKLLFYSVKEGWEPLCKFLDVPLPDVPFPRGHDSNEYGNEMIVLHTRAWIALYEVLTIPTLCYLAYRLWE